MAHDQTHTTAEGEFDPMDPHGHHAGEDHGHHIVSQRMLLAVLTALLVFTLATVAASRIEVFIAEAFDVEIPQSVNVLIAMSIAVVKGSLVALFFMQLWYDKALNGLIFCFCLLALALFLGFSTLDLGGRDTIHRFKDDYQTPGGTGGMSYIRRDPETGEPLRNDEGDIRTDTIAGPIAEFARNNPDFVKGRIGAETYEKLKKKHDAEHDQTHGAGPTPDRATPMYGRLLFADAAHAGTGAGDEARDASEDADAASGDPSDGDDGAQAEGRTPAPDDADEPRDAESGDGQG